MSEPSNTTITHSLVGAVIENCECPMCKCICALQEEVERLKDGLREVAIICTPYDARAEDAVEAAEYISVLLGEKMMRTPEDVLEEMDRVMARLSGQAALRGEDKSE